MGSFSYTCQLSGLPITSGTKCAILPMLPRDDFYDNGEAHFRNYGKSMFCSNEGVNIFFNELAFPIFGKYDDYGGIEDIIHDDNTKCLEEYFEMSIEDICKIFCDSEKPKSKNPKLNLLSKTSLVWFHTDFYKKLASEKSASWKESLDLGVRGILLKLGFKYNNTGKQERYNQEYEKDGLKIYSDGNWINVSSQNSIYNFKQLQKYCKKNGVDIDISELDSMGYHEQIYEVILPYIKDLKGYDRWESDRAIHLLLGDEHKIRMGGQSHNALQIKFLKHDIKSIEKGEQPMFYNYGKGKSIEQLEKILIKLEKEVKKEIPEPSQYLAEYYFQKIKSEKNSFLKKNIIDWHIVKSYYYPQGKYLYPIGVSPQDGDIKSLKIFNDVVSKTINEYMERCKIEYGDDCFDDDFDEL